MKPDSSTTSPSEGDLEQLASIMQPLLLTLSASEPEGDNVETSPDSSLNSSGVPHDTPIPTIKTQNPCTDSINCKLQDQTQNTEESQIHRIGNNEEPKFIQNHEVGEEEALVNGRHRTAPPTWWRDYFVGNVSSNLELETFDEAASDPNWFAAMRDEFKLIHKNSTRELVPLPPGKTTISTK